jgi:hypothetical protein
MAGNDTFELEVYDDELGRYVRVRDPSSKSLSVRKQSPKATQKRRFEAKQAERLRANEAATANIDKLGSGIASIPGRVVKYIKSSTPSSVGRDVKGIAKATYDAAVEDPNAFIEDAIFSPLAAIRDFGDVRETARKLRAQGRDADAEKMEAMAGTAVLSAVPILGRPAGVATRKAIKAAEKTAVKGATKAATKGAEKKVAAKASEMAVTPKKKGPDVVQRKTRNISKAKAEGQKIVGAPLGVNTPADEALRRKEYANTMEIGRAGASWYDDSGKAILENVGDDPTKARRASEVFSITSSGTGVPANTGFAVKGMNQASYGDPVVTGRFPTAMGGQIEDLYRGDTAVTGKKRTPFADQLAIGGGFYDPSITGQGHRGVHDIWDGEAWGYTDAEGRPIRRAFQDAEHDWMDRQMNMVLKNYVNDPDIQGLPGRGQAATWTGAKIQAGDISPEDAAYSYADDISRLYALGSREAVPGSNTGNLQGLLDAPFEQRKEYTDQFMPIFFDEAGRDRIALNNDMLVGPSFEGPGVYEGVNPGRQAQYAVGTTRVEVPNTKSTDPRVDPASRNLMLNNEAIFGLLGAQKGIAGNRFFTDVPKSRSNAFEIDVGGRPISYDEGKAALSVLSRAGFTPDDFAIVPSPRGVRAMDLGVFDEDLARMQAEDPEMYKQVIKDRMERLNRFSGELGNELGGTSTPGFMDSIYAENAFDTPEGMFGQQYLPYIFPDDRPQFVDRFNAIAPGMAEKLRELDKRTSKDYGFDISSNIDDMRAAIAAEGEAGLRALIRRRGLGKAKGGMVERDMVNAAGDLGLLSEKYA